MVWEIFTKPLQAKPGVSMRCPSTGKEFIVKRRGKVDGRVGILIEYTDGTDVAVVDAKNNWYVEKQSAT